MRSNSGVVDVSFNTVGKIWSRLEPSAPPSMMGRSALDADNKLIEQWFVCARGGYTANLFIEDVASRLANREQLTLEGLRAYLEVGCLQEKTASNSN